MGRVTISSNNLFPGPKGKDGSGITSVTDNGDGTLTIGYGDGHTVITSDLTGPTGPQGPQGNQGGKGDTGAQGPVGNTGAQGPKGDTGATGAKGDTGATGATGAKGDTGATGAQGPSGVVSVTSPITNSGTSTAANIGIDQTSITIAESQVTNLVTDLSGKVATTRTISTTSPLSGGGALSSNLTLSVGAGSTSTAGVLQLTDSTSSTSTTTAATPNSVKSAYDLAVIKNPVLKQVSGSYMRTPFNNDFSVAAASIGHQRVYYTPIYVGSTTTFDRLAIRTGSTFVGTATVRIGIYNDSNGQPSTVVLDAGTVSCTAATTIYEITINQSLTPGFYWLAMVQQGTAPTTAAYFGVTAGGTLYQNYYIMSSTSPSAAATAAFTQNSVTGAFATAGTLTASTIALHTWIRAS